MQLILITPPSHHPYEFAILETAKQLGIHRIHIRKPSMEASQLHKYCQQLSPEILAISSLHYYENFMEQYAFSGFHFSSLQVKKITTEENIFTNKKITSSSFHSPLEIEQDGKYLNYGFCSPVYPSISKQNYAPNFEWNVNGIESHLKLFALGGVDIHKAEDCQQRGFDGIAVLGSIWKHTDASKAIRALAEIQETCEQLR